MGLKEIREEHGMTQLQLAARVGMEQQAISRIETGGLKPSNMALGTAKKLCDVLGCSPWALLDDNGNGKLGRNVSKPQQRKDIVARREKLNRKLGSKYVVPRRQMQADALALWEACKAEKKANSLYTLNVANAVKHAHRQLMADAKYSEYLAECVGTIGLGEKSTSELKNFIDNVFSKKDYDAYAHCANKKPEAD